jgi:hypothetical protein
MGDSSTHEHRRSPRGHSKGDVPPALGAADDAAALAGIAAAPPVGIAAPAYSRAVATACRSPCGHSRGDVPPDVGAADVSTALAGIAATPPVGIAAPAYSHAGATAGRTGTAGRAGTVVVVAAACNPPAGARNRGTQYHRDKIDAFLDLMEDNLPIGPQEWDDVTEFHADRFLLKNQDSQSLRRKFKELVNSKKPTGDPNCPPHIRQAKLIQKRIIAKSDSGGGSLNNDDLSIVDDNEEIDPRNLLPALENTTTTLAAALENSTTTSDANGNVTATLRSMVTPRRRNESGRSVGSVMDMMVANMMERQQLEFRECECQERLREQAFNECREERKLEQEERKAEQEERRLD